MNASYGLSFLNLPRATCWSKRFAILFSLQDHFNPENIQKTKGMMHSFAMGEAMIAAANDYKNLMKAEEDAAAAARAAASKIDMRELQVRFSCAHCLCTCIPTHIRTLTLTRCGTHSWDTRFTTFTTLHIVPSSSYPFSSHSLQDDEDLQKLYEERMARLKEEHEKRQKMQQQGHGKLEEIHEKDFLEVVTKTEKVVVHFYHKEFERCRIMDKHLSDLAKRYFKTRFIKISAPDAPFFVEKLNVQVLPCIIMFRDGVAVERTVGFEGLGKGKDDFKTELLEAKMLEIGVIQPALATEDAEPEQRTGIRKGFALDDDSDVDEDSDFED